MAQLEYQGALIEIAEDWRVGELIEAENALDIDMEKARGGAKMALIAYITIRRVDKDIPKGVLADAVLSMELTDFASDDEAKDDAGPPDEAAADMNGRHSETAEPLTSGLPLSGSSV